LLLIPTEFKSWNGATQAITGAWRADSLRGRFARGAVWSLIGAVIAQGTNLAASVITARLLGREQFGEYGMIQSTVGMFGILAGMGLGLTATRYVAEFRGPDPARAGRVIALATAVALGTSTVAVATIFAVAPWLAANTLNAPHLSAELRIAAGMLFLNALIGTQVGVLAGFEAFHRIARVNLARGVLTFPLAVAGVWLWGLRGAVLALVAAAAVGWVLNHMAIHEECTKNGVPVRWTGFWSDRFILWKFSAPAFLGGAMTSLAMWAANSLLVNQPHGYAKMGVFSAANQWRMAVAFLPLLLCQPLLPMLSNVGVCNLRSFRKLLTASLWLGFGLSGLVAAPIALCSPWIMQAYGRDFRGGRPVLILLVLATVISSTAAVIGQAIASLDKMWWGFGLNSVWALVMMAVAVLLVPRYGALGLAGAFLASYSIHALTVGAFVHVHFRNTFLTIPSSHS
jgi:O-antigen/teichoic acid export membrane protein